MNSDKKWGKHCFLPNKVAIYLLFHSGCSIKKGFETANDSIGLTWE